MTIDVETVVLERGNHPSPQDGLCVMELAAYLAGREHSDRPVCVSPAIGAFLRSWNDSLADEPRQLLKPYAERVLRTATTKKDEERRAWLATDWLVREFAPAWLDLAGLSERAQELRDLPELSSAALARKAQPIIGRARQESAAAGAAARDAAWAATWDAAGDATRAATRDAAWDAARAATRDAAWDAARDAAGAATRDAAWDAAWDAAGAALEPTVLALQESAFGLLDRMIEVGKTDLVPA